MYVYRVITKAGTFTGLCCCLPVDDYESGVIRRHEQTRYDKEEDRTRHIDAVNAHTGPVVLIYRDTADLSGLISSLASGQPEAEVCWTDGSVHQVYRILDAGILSRLDRQFSTVKRLYIADGHHRAKSAANVAKQRRAAGREIGEADRFMGVLFADSGVRIHGTAGSCGTLAGGRPVSSCRKSRGRVRWFPMAGWIMARSRSRQGPTGPMCSICISTRRGTNAPCLTATDQT